MEDFQASAPNYILEKKSRQAKIEETI